MDLNGDAVKPAGIVINATIDVRATKTAYNFITEKILLGNLKPGERLGIGMLASASGLTSAGIRETLAGLEGRGLVRGAGSRAYYVTDLSEKDFNDLMHTRFLLEGVALRDSVLNGDSAWDEAVATALERLSSSTCKGTEASTLEFVSLHKAFHRALISASGLTRVLDYLDSIYDQHARYYIQHDPLRGYGSSLFDSHDVAGHQRLANVAFARDLEGVSEELRNHLFLPPVMQGTGTSNGASPLMP